MGGVSIASVVLSYFMVAGGMFAATLLGAYMHLEAAAAPYVILAAGAFAGSFFAAHASRGSTILEPAIGALAVIGTIVALVASTDIGKQLWAAQHDEVVKLLAKVAGSAVLGAMLGAWIGERFFGDAPTSTVPWFLYAAFATFGSSLIVMMIFAVLATSGKAEAGKLLTMTIGGLGAGCLLGGIAVGASSRSRPLFASFIGGGCGVLGFLLLLVKMLQESLDSNVKQGFAIFAIGGAVLTLIGALIGWAAVGKRAAGAVT